MTLARLARLADEYIEGNEHLPGIFALRKSEPQPIEAVVYNPLICLILQGSKETVSGAGAVHLRDGDMLLVSHDLPVVSRITQTPYLALILRLDLAMIRGLYEQLGGREAETAVTGALRAWRAGPDILEPLSRYLALASDATAAQVLGPLILKELHFRLLNAPTGQMLRNLLLIDSHASRVARAIQRIRAEFRTPLAIPYLARTAGMSASSFHAHFRSVTGTTPLQYVKDLRLIEARGLLQSGRSVSAAAFDVGYESPTHFSRDYARKFGLPPSRDQLTAA